MPKRQNDYSPGQYRIFSGIKEILSLYEPYFEVTLDQKESYYLSVPNKTIYGDEAGTMFAAVQIKDNTVDLFIGVLITKKANAYRELIKDIEGLIDPKGVIHIFFLSKALKEVITVIIKLAAFQYNCY